MNLDTFLTELTHEATTDGHWWAKAALWAAARGYWRAIPTRQDPDKLLLVRFWLNVPKKPANPGDIWESADSVLIHYLLAPDDDPAVHDHRWSFSTQILSGGYREEIPGADWNEFSELGPSADQYESRERVFGDTIRHAASDLHRIAEVLPGTVSLVTTGPHVRDWGFHPPGLPWVGHERYLA
jgi:hypothetical protein